MPRRRLSWNTVLRDLRADRITVTDIREERIAPIKGVPGFPAIRMSAWRGLSAKRYLVRIYDIATADPADLVDVVVVAVARDADGHAVIVRPDTDLDGAAAWIAAAKQAGANEVHVHHLAETAIERAAIVVDLTAIGPAARQAA